MGNGISRATLRDVAERAGVSTSIASRVLNGDKTLSVRPETHTRVVEAARSLRYRPHAAARGVRGGTIGALGLLVPDLTQPIYARIVRGAVAQANKREVVVLVVEDLAEGPIRRDANRQVARMVQERRIDGLMIASIRPRHPVLKQLRDTGLPHVFVNRSVRGSRRNVSLDDAKVSVAAVNHLVGLGHRHLGHVAGPPQLAPSRRREKAFMDEIGSRTLPAGHVTRSAFNSSGGYAAALELMKANPEITGVYTSNFGQAVGTLRALHTLGLAVPEDVSVITNDDVPMAGYIDPPLTTIRVPLERLGAAGVDQLLAQLNGADLCDVVVDTVAEVIPRGTTGPSRG